MYIFIHGANATSKSFNYIIKELNLNETIMINYNSNDGFYFNLEQIIKNIKKYNNDSFNIISHSLGGIYAIHLTKYINVNKVVSMSTPFNGSSFADWAKYLLPNYQLFRDVGVNTMPIIESNNIEIKIPWIQLVSTSGKVPWLVGDNDGIVTYMSMTSRNDVQYHKLPYNHYEIMCVPQTVQIIKKHFQL
jgi:hypothetical protein